MPERAEHVAIDPYLPTPTRLQLDDDVIRKTPRASDVYRHEMNRFPESLPSSPTVTMNEFPMSQETSPSETSPPSNSLVGRRRKVPDSITSIACTNCQKARAKCDGLKPACQRCQTRHIPNECRYQFHAKTAKEQMVREIRRLQSRNETLQEENGTLEEKNDWIERIMDSLKDDGQRTKIIQCLKRGETHRDIAEWLGRPLTENTTNLSPSSELQLSEAIEKYHHNFIDNHDPRFWTNVTMDPCLIEHLVHLYFTWIHPVHMLFDEGKFLESFKNCADKYCSPSLVNAICAMSCYLLHKNWDSDEDIQVATSFLRIRFMDEARSSLKDFNDDKMTVIQTYAILFLAELSSGSGRTATSHLRLAAELLIDRQQVETFRDSEEISSWGLLTLHTLVSLNSQEYKSADIHSAWSGITYVKPSAPFSTKDIIFPDVAFDHGGTWPFYRQPGDDGFFIRPGHAILIASEHAKLYRIIHQTILTYCGNAGEISADRLSGLCDQFVEWKDDLPRTIQNVDGDYSTVPHALFLHIQYYTGLVNLLQPLIHLVERDQPPYDYLRGLIIHHAKQGLALLRQYQQMFTFVYQSPLQLFCVVHICDALARYGAQDESRLDIVRFCIGCLQAAKASYPLAGPLQKMFCLALTEYGMPISDDFERLNIHLSQYGPEEMLEAVTRLTYRVPISQLLPSMRPTLAEEFVRQRQQLEDEQSDKSRSSQEARKKHNGRIQIDSLLNT